MTALWVLIAVIVVGMGYIRLAPSNAAQWHQPPQVDANEDLTGGVKRLVTAGPEALGQLDAIARTTPRTSVLAGSVQEGMVTYVTRSRIMGFPDYTTVEANGDQLKIYARLRFGNSDLGINGHRIDEWLTKLERVTTGG